MELKDGTNAKVIILKRVQVTSADPEKWRVDQAVTPFLFVQPVAQTDEINMKLSFVTPKDIQIPMMTNAREIKKWEKLIVQEHTEPASAAPAAKRAKLSK